MRVAIYARKSNDDNDKNPEHKSVANQIAGARRFAEERGWFIDDDLILVDDGISGAEYQNRPGFARLLASLKHFDVLIMSESSRLGRDMTRNSAAIVDIIEHGKRIFYYLTGEEEKADTPEQKVILTLRSYASEVERLKAGQRSRDALRRKAERGYNAGGRVYGYDNARDAEKGYTDYRINETEADTLRRIFRMYADGHGHVTVAKTMNGDMRYADLARRYFDGARPPSPRNGTGSWAPSSVRAMLYNERYTGVVPFGEHRKVYRRGTKGRERRPTAEVLRTQRPDLRIIGDHLWRDVQARLASVRKTYVRDTGGQLWGRPGMGVESKYLLTGLSECGCCGHNITMLGGRGGVPGKRSRLYYYGCSYHATRGRTICENDLRANMDETDQVVLDRVRERVLTPAAIDFTINEAVRLMSEHRKQKADLPERQEAALRKERQQLENLIAAVADGKAPPSVMEKIRALEASIAAKEHDLDKFSVEEPSELDLRRLKKAFRERLGRFDALMRSDVPVARQALRKLLAGRIIFRPVSVNGMRSYHLRWGYTLKPLIDDGYIGMATPRGFEPRLPP